MLVERWSVNVVTLRNAVFFFEVNTAQLIWLSPRSDERRIQWTRGVEQRRKLSDQFRVAFQNRARREGRGSKHSRGTSHIQPYPCKILSKAQCQLVIAPTSPD